MFSNSFSVKIKEPKKPKISLKTREVINFFIFVSPGLIGFLLLGVYPMFRSLYLSFTNRTMLSFEPVKFIGFKNYIRAFQDEYVWDSLKITFIFTIFTILISNGIGLASALFLNSFKGKASSLYRTIFYMPSILPAVSMIVMFSWIFNPASGIVNTILRSWGVENPPLWFQGTDSALWTLILTSFWAFGGKMVIYLAARQGVSSDLYEASEMDGASSWQQFIHVTVPSMSNIIFYNVLMSIIGGLQVFTEAYVLSGTGEGVPINFYVVNLYSHAFNSPNELGYASALAWILFVIVMVLVSFYYLVQRRINKKYR